MHELTGTTISRRAGVGLGAALFVSGLARAQSAPPGLRLAAFRTRGQNRTVLVVDPSGPGPASGAALMLLHGAGGLRSDMPTFYGHAVDWSRRGWTVVMPNYLTETGDPMTEDVRWWARSVVDATAWAAALPDVDPARIVAMGYSRGGFLAAGVAVQETDIAAVVGVCSAGDVEPRDIVRRPPILLIRAEHDDVIPAHRTIRWAGILEGQGVPVQTEILPGATHRLTPEAWTSVFAHAETFFARTLQVDAARPRPDRPSSL